MLPTLVWPGQSRSFQVQGYPRARPTWSEGQRTEDTGKMALDHATPREATHICSPTWLGLQTSLWLGDCSGDTCLLHSRGLLLPGHTAQVMCGCFTEPGWPRHSALGPALFSRKVTLAWSPLVTLGGSRGRVVSGSCLCCSPTATEQREKP